MTGFAAFCDVREAGIRVVADGLRANIRHLLVADNTRRHSSLALQAQDGVFGTTHPGAFPRFLMAPFAFRTYPLMPVIAMPRMKVFMVRKKSTISGRLKTVEAAIRRCHVPSPCTEKKVWSDRLRVNCDGWFR